MAQKNAKKKPAEWRVWALILPWVGLSMLAGCVAHERVVVRETVAVRPAVRHMPAPIREDRSRPPGPDWNWVSGHWKWEGNDWFWVHGRWV